MILCGIGWLRTWILLATIPWCCNGQLQYVYDYNRYIYIYMMCISIYIWCTYIYTYIRKCSMVHNFKFVFPSPHFVGSENHASIAKRDRWCRVGVDGVSVYPLVICYIAIENGPFSSWIYPLIAWWCSIVMLTISHWKCLKHGDLPIAGWIFPLPYVSPLTSGQAVKTPSRWNCPKAPQGRRRRKKLLADSLRQRVGRFWVLRWTGDPYGNIWKYIWEYMVHNTRPGKRLHNELENHHAINGKTHELNGPFSIAMLVCQRVYTTNYWIIAPKWWNDMIEVYFSKSLCLQYQRIWPKIGPKRILGPTGSKLHVHSFSH